MKNGFAYITGIAAALCLTMVCLLTSVELVAFNIGYYRGEYRKLERPQVIGISEQELLTTTRGLLDYLRDRRDNLKLTATIKGEKRLVFNEREISHMKDVKELFQKGYRLRIGALMLIPALIVLLWLAVGKKAGEIAARSFIIAAVTTLGCILLLVMLLNMDFTRYFDQFHYIFFNNDLWQLDPNSDVLIQMVPETFFYDTAFRIILLFIGAMAFFTAIAWRTLKKNPNLSGTRVRKGR